MMKRFLLLLLCLGMLALPVLAAEGEGEQNPGGVCGETMLWELDGDTLTVFGQGAMEDFDMMAPWSDYRERITRVELMGVTYVGSFAFTDFDNITEADLGDALEELGQSAFSDCDGLTELTFPETFRVLGEESLSGCDNLTALHCSGKFPSFRQNCLWQTSVKIYFPAERPWSVELIAQLEEAFHGIVEFLASDGSDPYTPTEPEASVPEETTEASTTAPETTASPTETVTEATAAPTTRPVTEQTTEPAPQTVPTVPPTEKPSQPEKKQGGYVLLVVLIFLLALVCLGILMLRPKKKKSARKKSRGGKYSRR